MKCLIPLMICLIFGVQLSGCSPTSTEKAKVQTYADGRLEIDLPVGLNVYKSTGDDVHSAGNYVVGSDANPNYFLELIPPYAIPAAAPDKRAYVETKGRKLWPHLKADLDLKDEPKPTWMSVEGASVFGAWMPTGKGDTLEGYLLTGSHRVHIRVYVPRQPQTEEAKALRQHLLSVLPAIKIANTR